MVQVIPQFQITQTFGATPTAATEALRALLIGPDYVVRRYEDDKADILLGTYTGDSLAVSWPGRLAGEVVDQSFTEVHVDQAAMIFYEDLSSAQSDSVTLNLIVSPTTKWADNPGFARTVAIPGDVAVGDWVRLSDASAGVNDVQVTRVTSLVADVVASSHGSAVIGGSNPATNAGSSSTGHTGTGTAANSITGLANPANYHGETVGTHGQMTETYTITVATVGAQGTGNAGDWTTVRLNIVSASGTDAAQTGVIPAPATPFAVGSRGARLTLSHGGSGNDFVVGDTYTVVVAQTYTRPTVAITGTYTGDEDTTYIVTVTTPGLTGSVGKITVSTTTAVDQGGPYSVTTGTPISIGTKGLIVTLTGSTLVVNDSWTFTATAASSGAIHTLGLANQVTTNLRAINLKVEVGQIDDIVVPKNQVGNAPTTNWSTSATQITLAADMVVRSDRFEDEDLTVASGTAYSTYRALRTATAGVPVDIITTGDVTTNFSGADDVDSVMSYACHRAIANAAGTTIKAISVATDDLAGYEAALLALKDREDFWRIVPLTHATNVIDACISTATSRSGADVGRWATVMMALDLNTSTEVTSGLATIVDDPSTGGTQYTVVHLADGDFVAAGVVAGDELRANYTTDGFGTQTYTAYTIDAVLSNEEVRLISGPSVGVSVASQIQVWHNLSLAEQVADWGTRTQARSDRRVTSVWPPHPGREGVRVPSYYMAAALAALRGASAPHQGLTNAEVLDWDDLRESSQTFAAHLDTVANYGGYIVTQSPSGQIYIRKQLTTDLSDTKHAEDSATSNLDSCSFFFKELMAPKVGKSNVVDSNLDGIRADLLAGITQLRTQGFTDLLGAQIGPDSALVYVRRHATLLDKVVAKVNLDLPIPLNNGELELVV